MWHNWPYWASCGWNQCHVFFPPLEIFRFCAGCLTSRPCAGVSLSRALLCPCGVWISWQLVTCGACTDPFRACMSRPWKCWSALPKSLVAPPLLLAWRELVGTFGTIHIFCMMFIGVAPWAEAMYIGASFLCRPSLIFGGWLTHHIFLMGYSTQAIALLLFLLFHFFCIFFMLGPLCYHLCPHLPFVILDLSGSQLFCTFTTSLFFFHLFTYFQLSLFSFIFTFKGSFWPPCMPCHRACSTFSSRTKFTMWSCSQSFAILFVFTLWIVFCAFS